MIRQLFVLVIVLEQLEECGWGSSVKENFDFDFFFLFKAGEWEKKEKNNNLIVCYEFRFFCSRYFLVVLFFHLKT